MTPPPPPEQRSATRRADEGVRDRDPDPEQEANQEPEVWMKFELADALSGTLGSRASGSKRLITISLDVDSWSMCAAICSVRGQTIPEPAAATRSIASAPQPAVADRPTAAGARGISPVDDLRDVITRGDDDCLGELLRIELRKNSFGSRAWRSPRDREAPHLRRTRGHKSLPAIPEHTMIPGPGSGTAAPARATAATGCDQPRKGTAVETASARRSRW